MKKIVQNIFAVLLVFALGFGSCWGYLKYKEMKDAEIVDSSADGFDLRLPGEVEKSVVTLDEVEVQLQKIGQLAVHSGEYTVSKSREYIRHFFDDIPIPGTKNSIGLKCNGVVKVGFDIDEIAPTLDNESQKIYISLPEPEILDNYVIWDSVECEEKNSIFNPIEFDQYQQLIDEIEEEGLAQAEKDGLYEAAEENTRTVIREFLSGFDGYEVVFL